MSSYKLVSYQSAKGPRAGVVVDDKLFDAAALTRNAAYASVLDILNDWASAKGTLKKAATAAGKSKLKSQPVARARLLAPVLWLAGAAVMLSPIVTPSTARHGPWAYAFPALFLAVGALGWFVTWWFVLPVWSRIRHQAFAGQVPAEPDDGL